ncbi:unnamed protein product [Hermetia illucens]|uniref:Uncharacterized protein n=1 Tax=Hermetia illucens TaxID=343691 RepID=A0A7R8YRC1_HERIL|nr:cuticle protein 16.5-like [Hermetia illucens]CAD7082701.1 unnamed protein product [Hermetia illucens]
MVTKCIIFFVLAVIALAQAGIIAPYAASYNAHAINHAIAAPVVAAAPAPLVAAAPALPAAYSALPAAYSALPAAYSALPAAYSAYPAIL